MNTSRDLSATASIVSTITGDAESLIVMAETVVEQDADLAFLLAKRALEVTSDPRLATWAKELTTRNVPNWHFDILQDHLRNASYAKAIGQMIEPGMTVLEIGTGSGLLAILAAQAGADHVFTCESSWRIADAARSVIAANGLSHKITVISASSGELSVERHLHQRADLLIGEVFSNELIGEGALPAYEHAVTQLLKPNCPVIPQTASVKVALAYCDLARIDNLSDIQGVDLSEFSALAPRVQAMRVDEPSISLTSSIGTLFSFSLASGGPFPESRAFAEVEATGGPSNAVLQWIELALTPDVRIENRPGTDWQSSWKVLAYPLADRSKATQGPVRIYGEHNRHLIRIWL